MFLEFNEQKILKNEIIIWFKLVNMIEYQYVRYYIEYL